MTSIDQLRARFHELHRSGIFVMPNPFDIGSARLLAALGFEALATTSAGHAGTLGRLDMEVSREELIAHVTAMAGAAGCSIEDWDPAKQCIDEVDVAVARVKAAASAASTHGVLLTARCENHLHGINDLDDTIRRLCAYRDAGAPAVYAPGLMEARIIERVVKAVEVPLNVLLMPGGPSVSQLAAMGVRRVSVGSSLARIAHGAVVHAAQQLLAQGTVDTIAMVDGALLRRAFTT